MPEEIVKSKLDKKDNSAVDAIAAVGFACIFVATIVFWLSNH